jgi:hypothetical protein
MLVAEFGYKHVNTFDITCEQAENDHRTLTKLTRVIWTLVDSPQLQITKALI